MSVVIDIGTLTEAQKNTLSKLKIRPNLTRFGFKAPIKIYRIQKEENTVLIPFWTAIELFSDKKSNTLFCKTDK